MWFEGNCAAFANVLEFGKIFFFIAAPSILTELC
jgi:hypothetical protein